MEGGGGDDINFPTFPHKSKNDIFTIVGGGGGDFHLPYCAIEGG